MSTIHNEIRFQREMDIASQVISARQFWANISVSFIDPNNDQIFEAEFAFTDKDPEFQKFINEWAARKLAEQLLKKSNK